MGSPQILLLRYIPHSWKYWRQLNLAVEPKITITTVLVDFNVVVAHAHCQTAKFNSMPNFPAIQYSVGGFCDMKLSWQKFHRMVPTSVLITSYLLITKNKNIPGLEYRAFQTYVERGLETLKNGQKQLKSSTIENIFNSFTPVSLDYLLSDGNLYWFCPLGRELGVRNSE